MENRFNGLGVALVTPFDKKCAIDTAALERLIDHVIEGGVDYIVALGTTAETPTLSHDERKEVANIIRNCTAGRVPLVIGMGGNDTAKLCAEIKTMDTEGFSAILSVAPYYNKPSQEGIFRHYQAVADSSPLPIILYNIPGRTGVNMTAATTLRIAHEIPNIIGMKEASGDIEQMREIIAGAPMGFVVLSGDDGMTLPLMKTGGGGVISVLANVLPRETAKMVRLATKGDFDGAEKIWAGLDEACGLLFAEGNPTGVKTALSVKKLCRADVRLPLVAGSDKLRAQFSTLFTR